MKKTFKTIFCITFLSLLASCSGANVEGTSSSSGTSGDLGVSKDELFDVLVASPLAFKGEFSSKMIAGDEEFEMERISYNSLLMTDFYYNSWSAYGEVIEQRIEKDERGNAYLATLNPLTNTLDYTYVSDSYGQPYPFDAVFVNPFKDSRRLFDLVDGKLVLGDTYNYNISSLVNILTAGSGFTNYTDFDSLTISFVGKVPSTIELQVSDRAYEEYGQISVYSYTGTFVSAAEITVKNKLEVHPIQPGQEKLQAMFDSLKNNNYTLSITRKSVPMEDDFNLEEESEPEPTKAISYVTEGGYYNNYVSGFYGQASDGKYMTSEGIVDYQITSEGKVKELKKPMPTRNVDNYWHGWNYSSACFDVNDDGSFTLPALDGLHGQIWTELLPDFNAVSVGVVDPGSLRFVIDEVNNTLSYTYTCFSASEEYSVVISDIGTTVLPITFDDVEKYVPFTNWTDFCNSDKWNKSFGDLLDVLTGGHKDDVPFIDSPYNYSRQYSCDSEYIGEWPNEEEIIKAVYYADVLWECDTINQVYEYSKIILDHIASVDSYSYDALTDTYTYDNGSAKFSLTISIKHDLNTIDQPFKHAVGMVMEPIAD